jgi:hypothetical protein
MPANSFRFVSPGVRTNEIDQTELPQVPGATGPLCIGRARKGPFMKPVTVSSKEELFEIFGTPVSGVSGNGDVWRQGDVLAPTYGIYAAIAHLTNGDKCTFVRLGGDEHNSRTDGSGEAGWKTDITTYTNAPVKSDGGAYALLLTAEDTTAEDYEYFQGTGLNDLVWTGTRTAGIETVRVRIKTAPVAPGPDTFEYSIDGAAFTGGENCTLVGAPFLIPATGLSVYFGAVTGHVDNETWGRGTPDILRAKTAATLSSVGFAGTRTAGIYSVTVRVKGNGGPPDTYEYSVNGGAFTGDVNCNIVPQLITDTGIYV